MQILVADDDTECRQFIATILPDQPGRELVFACDGAEAWWHLTDPQRKFDLAIFDIHMPTVKGLSLLARMRTIPQLRDLPVILCTGDADRDTVTEACRLNIASFVVKPFKPDTLREKINLIANRRAAAVAV
jgi:two-component system chemotaxis response regulator CheY